MDWSFTEDGTVTYSDTTSTIKSEDIALIFGTSYKLQYVDPFLFLAYELRRWTLDTARIIICIGYGFKDDHINGILKQSLRQNRDRKLLAVIGPNNQDERKQLISELMNVDDDQIEIRSCGAKKFLSSDLSITFLSKLFPPEMDLIPELPEQGI